MAIAVLLIAALGAAGCGSSSKSTKTSTAAITKPAFLAKGNGICTRGNKELNVAQTKAFGNKKPSKAQITSFAKTSYTSIIQSQIEAVRALGAPAGDEATVKKMLDLAQKGLNTVKSNPTLLAGGADSFAKFRKVAHAYGLTRCASG